MRIVRHSLGVAAIIVVAAAAAWAIDIEGTAVVVPVAMHGPGALGTRWQTDLWISNMTMGRQEVTATLYPTSGEPVSTTVDVPSGDTVELRDVVLSVFGLDNAKGLIMLTVNNPSGFQATARIYNVGNPMGEFGQFVPGIAIARLERQAFVAGLAGVDGNRANFGIANPNDQAVDVTVYVLDSHGDLLPAGENLPVAGRILANYRDSTVGAAILARLRRGAGRRIDTLLTATRLE